jgi:DNA-binding HxlR family transcriptional regulator
VAPTLSEGIFGERRQSDSRIRRNYVRVNGASQQVLARLLEQKSGMTVDDLAESVGISRTAVNQYLMALECDGYIRRDSVHKTAARPGRVYVLTDQGANLFPKKWRVIFPVLELFQGARNAGGAVYEDRDQGRARSGPRTDPLQRH